MAMMKRFTSIIILVVCFLLLGSCIAEQKLVPNDVQSGDSFGWSVSISQEGTALIGAHYETAAGAAYTFKYNSGSGQYVQLQKLTASDRQASDYFGYSVSISQDGSTALIGAYAEDEKGSNAGAAYIFKINSTGQYAQLQKLTASNGQGDDRFGNSVSISQDGSTALIGAYYDSEKGTYAGAAYIFNYNSTSGQYDQLQKLTASDGYYYDYFGQSVSINGSTALIGANYEDEKDDNAGAAYIFQYNSTSGQYEQLQKLMASDGQPSDYFGYSVSISQDGSTALIGADNEDEKGSSAGAAYIFNYNSTSGQYGQIQKLMASDGEAGDNFGGSVSVSQDGSTALIGALFEDERGSEAGAAYIFNYNSGSGQYDQLQKLTASDGAANDYFGRSVSVAPNGKSGLIGAYGAGTGGSAYYDDWQPTPTPTPTTVVASSTKNNIFPMTLLIFVLIVLLI